MKTEAEASKMICPFIQTGPEAPPCTCFVSKCMAWTLYDQISSPTGKKIVERCPDGLMRTKDEMLTEFRGYCGLVHAKTP